MNQGGSKRFGLLTSAPKPLMAGRHLLLRTSIPGAGQAWSHGQPVHGVGQVWIPGHPNRPSERSSAPRQFSKSLFQQATLTLLFLNMHSCFLDGLYRHGRVEGHLI